MNLKGKKLLICEEALIDCGGHFQSWIKAIRQMHLDAGATVYVAGNKKVIQQVRDELEVLPVYTINSWDQTDSTSWSSWRRHLRVFAQNWRIFWQTRRALRSVGPVDMVLFTAVRVHQIIGLRVLCAWGLGKYFGGLTCFLLTSQAEYSADYTICRFPRRTALMAWILKSFGRLVRSGKVILAGDSHVTCGEYEKLAGVPMTLFPSPADGLRYDGPRSAESGPVFSMLGVSTWDKGIDIFQDAILRFLERNPTTNARFVLQWRVPCEAPDGTVTPISDRLRGDSRATLLEHRLSNEEYAHFFRETDFIVLPYRKCTYFNRISGVAVEAAVSGKPIIVTQDTWLEWALHEFASGIAISEGSADDVLVALERCCAERTGMLAKAADRAHGARRYNSAASYLSKLWSRCLAVNKHNISGHDISANQVVTVDAANCAVTSIDANSLAPKTVGIVSLYEWLERWDNYGTLLQNYALQRALKRLGFDAFWIRTRPARGNFFTQVRNLSLQLLFSPRELLTLLVSLSKNVTSGDKLANLDRFNNQHPRRFREFMEAHMNLSAAEYEPPSLLRQAPQADAYIVGSDNIWARVTQASFLEFGPPTATRIAYAVSAPWTRLSRYWKYRARKSIGKIQHLSVREREGLDICRELGRTDAVQLVDPTLLLTGDDWKQLSSGAANCARTKGNFMLGYFLNLAALEDIPWEAISETATAMLLDLLVVPLQGAELLIPEKNVYAPNPREWLDAVDKSACVITNSYHGAIFSILYHRPFVVLPQSTAQDRGGERIPNLLELLGLKDRLVRETSPDDIHVQMLKPINWSNVDNVVRKERQKGLDFLTRSLSDL